MIVYVTPFYLLLVWLSSATFSWPWLIFAIICDASLISYTQGLERRRYQKKDTHKAPKKRKDVEGKGFFDTDV